VNLFGTFRRRCRTYNTSSGLGPIGGQITSTLAGISAAGLVFASAGFGALYAWAAGSHNG
jgi:hypothetical protein